MMPETLLPLLPAACDVAAQRTVNAMRPLWLASGVAEPDTHAAFRGVFTLPDTVEVELRSAGASWFRIWLNGEYLHDGPARFVKGAPEYQSATPTLAAGRHVIAVQVHHHGVMTRMLQPEKPFLAIQVLAAGREVEVSWNCCILVGHVRTGRRINPQLAWVEWVDTRTDDPTWIEPAFNPVGWQPPISMEEEIACPSARLAPIGLFPQPFQSIGGGLLSEEFGYAQDDPAARFFLRDLSPVQNPAQGVWRRYDLGQISLVVPRFELELPAGSIVEIAYSEYLVHDRVAPWINLSLGPSCNLDHFVARGGRQTFMPLNPKGGRFVELHILTVNPAAINRLEAGFLVRRRYERFAADFETSDPLLNRIWQAGATTLLVSTEDASIDNPTRERGQWIGDLGACILPNSAIGFPDLTVIQRGLRQSAACAHSCGIVAGLCPGDFLYLPAYALNWVGACLEYHQLTGRRELLEELWPAARANMQHFASRWTADGLRGVRSDMDFIDWGYVPNDGSDMALNLLYARALGHWCRWCELLGREDELASGRCQLTDVRGRIGAWLKPLLANGDWHAIGFHRGALAALTGLIPPEHDQAFIRNLKEHMLACFPNDVAAPRLAAPELADPRLITPYFLHFVYPLLIERGEIEFVLDQMRICWGWMLGGGRTTMLEVFDSRWSHCHPWAACPTWQLTEYVLGIRARFDLGQNYFTLRIHPGQLTAARGSRLLAGGSGSLRIEWRRNGSELDCELEADQPVWVHCLDEAGQIGAPHKITTRMECRLGGDPARGYTLPIIPNGAR